jgi:hypothetical protein
MNAYDSNVEHQSPSVKKNDSKDCMVEKLKQSTSNGDTDFDEDEDGNTADGCCCPDGG